MAPKASPVKNETTKNPPQRGGDASIKNPSKRGVKKKEKNEKKNRRLKLKGWLETPADWEKFNAWAKINGEPRKIPEPEPIVRASKPLSQMKKRIEVLSKPQKKMNNECRRDLGVSRKALIAKPSKRIIILAKFVPKKLDSCREFPIKISQAALRYRASKRIIEISQPHEMPLSDYCKSLIDNGTQNVTSQKAIPRKILLELGRKAIECPDLLTDEERDIIMTPTGIYRSALTYKFTPWMEYLSLPSYRFLKDRDDEDAEKWKSYILEENETRGKRALEEKRRKAAMNRRQEEMEEGEASKLDEKQENEEENEKTEGNDEVGDDEVKIEENKENEEIAESDEQPEEKGEKNEDEVKIEENKEDEEIAETDEQREEKGDKNVDVAKEIDQEDSKKHEEPSTIVKKGVAVDSKKEDDEKAAERKAARNAWRFLPSPCKDDPFAIKRSALTGKVSPRMAELAVRLIREDQMCKEDPFAIRKSALTGQIPEGVSRLAIPNHPRDPIERPAPREKDSFGRPIYPMPPYGRKIPRVKQREPAKCPDKDKKDDDDDDVGKKQKKRRFIIDPIVYEATIDPCFDPERSKRQIKARKAAKEEMRRRREADGTNEVKEEERNEEKKEEINEEKKEEEKKNESPEIENTVDE